MKLSKIGIVLVAIGLVIAIFAPIWKWGIAPSFVKLPTDLDRIQTYEGVLTLYVDPTSMAILPPEMAVKIPLTITRALKSVKSDGKVTNIEEVVEGVGPGGRAFMDTDRIFALDRKTSENVAGHESDMDREGYSLFLPFGTEKSTYEIWDNDTGKVVEAQFVEEERLKGNNTERLETYVFNAKSEETMLIPPLGLPEEISGKDIKVVMGNPNLPISDTEKIPIEYLKLVDAKIAVEPNAGAIAAVQDYLIEYSVDASAAGMEPLKLASIRYSQTDESVADTVDEVADSVAKLDLLRKWLPLILLLAGIALMLLGLAVGLRKKT